MRGLSPQVYVGWVSGLLIVLESPSILGVRPEVGVPSKVSSSRLIRSSRSEDLFNNLLGLHVLDSLFF